MNEVLHKGSTISLSDAKFRSNEDFKGIIEASIEDLKSNLPSGFKWTIRWYPEYNKDSNPFWYKGCFGASLADDDQDLPVVVDKPQIMKAMFPTLY